MTKKTEFEQQVLDQLRGIFGLDFKIDNNEYVVKIDNELFVVFAVSSTEPINKYTSRLQDSEGVVVAISDPSESLFDVATQIRQNCLHLFTFTINEQL